MAQPAVKALINDLLAYSRVKTGEQDFARFETKAALDQAITNLQITIAETGAKITVDSLPTILGNEAQFIQLFQNLISKAIKFPRRRTAQNCSQSGKKRYRLEVFNNR